MSVAKDINMAGDEDHLPRQKLLRNRVDMTAFLEKEMMLFKNLCLVLKLFYRKATQGTDVWIHLTQFMFLSKESQQDFSVATRPKGSFWVELAHFTSRTDGDILSLEDSLIWLPKATQQVNVKPQSCP